MMHGYYSVDGVVYENKIEALLAGSWRKKSVIWHWHDCYNNVNWAEDPELTLKEVYRNRAQQLRDRYDWIVISFSGGSDSWTVLNSFLENDITVDEIFCRWPLKATENIFVPNKNDISTENILSEWSLTIKPQLDAIHQKYPKIKITIHDWSDEILKTEFDDDYWNNTGDHLNPGFSMKFNAIGHEESMRIEQGKRTCIVFGIDKPQIWVEENRVYCYFLDILTNTRSINRPGRTTELFYWTQDMPEITHVQARQIYRYMCVNPNLGSLVDRKKKFSFDRKHIWDSVIRGVVYPDYDLSNFQARKDTSLIHSRVDSWMKILPSDRFMDSWKNITNNLLTSIDDRFFNIVDGTKIGFQGFISPLYYLGDLPREPSNYYK
jgi:hypothetical protein